MVTGCVHHEDVSSTNVGVCRRCGRTVQYYPGELTKEPEILDPGRPVMTENQPEETPSGAKTKKKKLKLVE